MASSATGPTTLDNLPARPPTPPRETLILESSDLLIKSRPARPSPLNPRQSVQTPPNTNSSTSSVAADSTNPGSSRMGKRVGWSGRTEYREPPDYKKGEPPHRSSPLSAPSSVTPKPLKSILKVSSSPNPLASSLGSHLNGSTENINITEMLDSTIKQLAGSDRDSKLDAYMMLTRALKTSNNLPDRVALQDKMSLFMQFIQRDITSKNDNGTLDTSLVNHALTLLATFLHFQAIASTITADFAVFIIDLSIRSFEDPTSPKDVVRHFMQVVAFQTFPAKVMTADRVGRLVASLHKIEDHLRGKSIVMSRLHIYKRLLDKSRNHMAIHSDWIKDILTDMLSNIKDIRNQAITVGMEAGYSFRSGHQLTRKMVDILLTSNEELTYVEFYIHRLQEMVKDKARAAAVPQIWSVVTLFLRCPLDRWDFYAPWFSLIQSSFNTSDSQTKQEANYAWNRYVFLSLMDNKPTQKLLSALSQPLISQLRRKPSTKQPEEYKKLRATVIKGICNLYYYAFRPGSERSFPPEIAWDTCVQPVISQLLGLGGTREVQPDDVLQASRLIVGLLDVSTPFVWNEERIRDVPPVTPEELPSIESKWIRKNAERLFKGLGPIMDKNFLDLSNKESITHRLWSAIVGSVAAASAKDIKVSEDTANFFAHSFGLLSVMWSKGCPGNDELLASKFYPSVRNFIKILVDKLGLLPFTEKRLSMTVSNTFEPVATPSHRPDRPDNPRGLVRNPLQHLFAMLSSVPPGGSDDEAFSDFFQSAFEPFFIGKSDKIRLELTRELLRLLPQNTLSPFALWNLGAQAVQLSLSSIVPQGASSEEKPRGPEFREVVAFLERGLTSHPNLPTQSWQVLFDALSQRITTEFGDAGRAITIVEPLAKILVDELQSDSTKPSQKTLSAARILFASAKLPRDRHALDAARRKIWGAPAVLSKGTSADPFDSLYKLGNLTLSYCYDHFAEVDATITAAPFLQSIEAFLSETFASSGFKALVKLQEGLSLWFQDERAQLKLHNDTPMCHSIRELWTKICAELGRVGHLDKSQFDEVEGLLTAGFKSKHRFIVNLAAETWNTIVKDEESLDCSDSLKSIVSSLRSRVDVVLPGSELSSGEFGAQATSLDSQEDTDHVVLSTETPQQAAHAPAAPSSARSSQTSSKRKRGLEATPELSANTRSSKRLTRASRTSTPRLRHDNSQIQFQPVASSSPSRDASQHLTERQKEVRERQQQNAVLYSDMQSSSPAPPVEISIEPAKEAVTSEEAQQKATTPERATTYGELISSTPTPRRGQFIPLDGENDPPSSPPDPRPYPLLSEIQSRSRHNSLENWDFSSPPGSPVTSRQQVAQDAEPPHVALTNESTQSKTASKSKKRKTRSSKKQSPSPDIVPSSLPASTDRKVAKTRASKRREDLSDAPSTPVRKTPLQPINRQATPKSGDDEFVDARSSPERSSPALPEMPPPEPASKETSFALSEGDESQFMKLAAEVESKTRGSARNATRSKRIRTSARNSITAHGDSPSSGKENDNPMEPTAVEQDIIPSTPAEPLEQEKQPSQGRNKRKRKAATKSSDRLKKRRSMEPSVSFVEAEEAQISESADSLVPASQKPAVDTAVEIAIEPEPAAVTGAEPEPEPTTVLSTEPEVEPTIEAEPASVPVVESEPGPQAEPKRKAKAAPKRKASLKRRRSSRNALESTSQELPQATTQEAAIAQAIEEAKAQVEAENREEERDTDEEVMSQLITESNNNSVSNSIAAPEEAPSVIEDSMMDIGPATNEGPTGEVNVLEGEHEVQPQESNDQEMVPVTEANAIMERLKGGLDDLRSATLSRAEVYQIEDMLMDMKRELFEAERRGRQSV